MTFSTGAVVWNSAKYTEVEREIVKIESEQRETVEKNAIVIKGIIELSTSQRIEKIAAKQGLVKISPEYVTVIRIE